MAQVTSQDKEDNDQKIPQATAKSLNATSFNNILGLKNFAK